MPNIATLLLGLSLLCAQFTAASLSPSTVSRSTAQEPAKIETIYDAVKDQTTIELAPVQIAGEVDKYHSLHMSPAFSFPGRAMLKPAIVDFELQTVVKGRLRTDLYVVFIIDGEQVFLSSNRWAVKRPVPGRVWMGERLVFRMPYETFVRLTKAKSLAIKFDATTFSVGETQQQALRDLLAYMKPEVASMKPELTSMKPEVAGDKSSGAVVPPEQ